MRAGGARAVSHPALLSRRICASGALVPPLTFAREASQFRALAEHLGLSRVHLVGHSASACIALQIALEAPDIVHSLALLEPALLAVPSPPEVPRAMELYREGTSRPRSTYLLHVENPRGI